MLFRSIAAGFEGGIPKKVSVPIINAATLGGHADPIPMNDPIAVALDVAVGDDVAPTTRRRIKFEELIAEDDIDIPDFMR